MCPICGGFTATQRRMRPPQIGVSAGLGQVQTLARDCFEGLRFRKYRITSVMPTLERGQRQRINATDA